ncbi:olfactory receptor 56A4-like [Callospermophilus lateralis]|uniref:olfactory receptor 56A4-like n=1 Tax=Callospermophilus lateralis TaxID=76772 RepID=UPI004038D4E1
MPTVYIEKKIRASNFGKLFASYTLVPITTYPPDPTISKDVLPGSEENTEELDNDFTSQFLDQVIEFLMSFFPGMQDTQHWLSILLSPLLVLALGATFVLLMTIWQEASLHEPMYYLLAILSVLDVILCLTVIPNLILILFFYTLLLVFIFTKKAEKKIPSEVPILLNVLSHLIPPALNPIVYGVRTQEIKQGINKLFKSWS